MGLPFALLAGVLWLAVLLWAIRRRERGSELYLDLLAGGALFLLVAGFFWRTLSGDVYQPADGGDLVSFLFPTYRFAARELAQANLPLWNPHLYGGAPFVADIQAGFLYLPNLLLFLLRPEFDYRALQGMVIGHLFWAALGIYVLLRTLAWPDKPVARPAALLGALAFALSDPLLIHLGNLNLVAVLSWLPWTLAAYSRGLATGRLGWLAAAGLLFALGNYAGHAQSSLYIGLALGLYTLLWAALNRPAGIPAATWTIWTAGRLLVVLVLAALLTAPILLPAIQLTTFSERSAFAYQDTVSFSLAPTQLIGLITPGFFGRGPALHWSLWDRVEQPYAGVAALLLAAAALLLAAPRQRRQLWPWAGLALFGLVTALGVYAILHGWLTLLLPGFAQLRAPARTLVLWTLGVALLAAVGLDRLLARPQAMMPGGRSWFRLLRQGFWVLAGVVLPLVYLALLLTQESETLFLRVSVSALALVLAALCWGGVWALAAGYRAGWWPAGVFAGLMVGLLYFELAATGAYTDIGEADPTLGFQHPEIIEFLRQDPDLFRIDSRTEIEGLWQPDTAALVGLQDVGGIANPLALRQAEAQWAAGGGRDSPLYDMLNVKYVLVRDGTPLPEGKFELALDAPGELSVYRNLAFWPRAWLVHQATLATDMENAFAQIQQPGFDPTQQVVLAGSTEGLSPFGPLSDATGPESAIVTDFGSSRLAVTVESTAPGFLLLSELWYPDWQARVNGQPVRVIPANGALRAVPVPPGASTVELWFAPRAWWWGLVLAGVGLLAAVALVWLDRRTRRQKLT
jgi:hypothetical protein